MPVPIIVEDFIVALGLEKHKFDTDVIKVALTNSAPDKATSFVLADITEISYTNLVGRTLTVVSWSQVAGVAKLIFNDFDLEASGGNVGPFRYIVVYNDSSTAKNIIGYGDYGSSLVLNDGQKLALDFSDANGFVQLSIPTNP